MPEIVPVRTRRERETFVRLPWRIYRELPAWVPPLRSAQRRELDPARGHFFNDGFGSRARLFLALEGGEAVGRIAAIRNERHLAAQGDGVGFFGFFESVDSPAVAGALLAAAESWLAGEGLRVSRGPASFTIVDPAGVTVEGFDLRPSVQIAYTPPYYAPLLEGCGYRKARDLLCYHAPVEGMERDFLRHARDVASAEADGFAVRTARSGDHEAEAALFARIFSASWERNWGAWPLGAEDLLQARKDLGPFFQDSLAAVLSHRGEPVGVLLSVLDPGEVLHRLDGRIGLRGMLRILGAPRKVERLRILIFGLLPEHRLLSAWPLLLGHVHRQSLRFPALKTLEFSWILEENRPMRQLAEGLGGVARQRLRIYEKHLDR